MGLYAALDGGVVVEQREIDDWDNYPQDRKDARDEKGDGGPVLRPIVFSGIGAQVRQEIHLDRVDIIRFDPPPTPEEKASLVDSEAQRRINIVLGASGYMDAINKQTNANMRIGVLNDKRIDGVALTASETAELAELKANANNITHINNNATALKMRNPIPDDYEDDKYWV